MVGTRSARTRPHEQIARLLTEAREQQRVSRVQAAEALQMPLRHLEALEEGDLSIFAAEVYGRGAFLRYAAFLGIDARRAERVISEALSASRERVPLKLHTPASWLARLATPRTMIVLALSVLGLGVGGYIVWQVESFWRLPDLQIAAPVAGIVDQPRVVIEGVAEAEARVAINGETVLLDPDGRFAEEMSFQPGVNVVRVEAENAAGRIRVVERHFLLPRS